MQHASFEIERFELGIKTVKEKIQEKKKKMVAKRKEEERGILKELGTESSVELPTESVNAKVNGGKKENKMGMCE